MNSWTPMSKCSSICGCRATAELIQQVFKNTFNFKKCHFLVVFIFYLHQFMGVCLETFTGARCGAWKCLTWRFLRDLVWFICMLANNQSILGEYQSNPSHALVHMLHSACTLAYGPIPVTPRSTHVSILWKQQLSHLKMVLYTGKAPCTSQKRR